MRMKEILPVFVAIIFGFIVGFILGIYLSPNPTIIDIRGWLSGGFTLVLVVNIVLWYWNRRKEERIRQEAFLIEDLKGWVQGTIFYNINYSDGQIIGLKEHKDPTLTYFKEVEKVLQKCKIYDLWIEWKVKSEFLKNEGKEALDKFHIIVNKATKDIHLKKLLKLGGLPEPYYSFPRICEAIYDDINGSALNLSKSTQKQDKIFLSNGATTLAWGEPTKINRLKKIIENLIKDKNVKKQITIYTEAKRKLDSACVFEEFNSRLNKLIIDWERFHEFRPQT